MKISMHNLSQFEKNWLKLFAAHTDKKLLNTHVISPGNYIWHIFSFEILPKCTFLIGKEARNAFDLQDKENAIMYLPFQKKIKEANMSAEEIDSFTECYVVSEDKTWTYIKTHEDMCGPYFYKKEA